MAMADPQDDDPRRPEAEGGLPDAVGGDPLIGAAMEGLRRAAAEVEQIAAVAETLQRSLLSERLPEIVGLQLAARYRAASVDAHVGGDWYEVVALRNGRAGIAIGDVVGHGIDAAARMASLKSAMRAYALEGLRPSMVLERMNSFVRELEEGAMATLLYGVLDPAGQLRFASAGHPPPLVIDPSGEAHYVEGEAGTPLGVVAFPRYEDHIVALEPGTVVLLYTDGLVERSGASLDAGLAWLREFASGTSSQPSKLCVTLLDACFRTTPPRDDVALLAASIEPQSPDGVEITLAAEPESLASMRRGMARWLRSAGASDAEVYELLVACGEACSNAVAHAYPPGEAVYRIEGRSTEDGVEVTVTDYGEWRDPRQGSQGRGLQLIDKLVDGLAIDRRANGTVVTMRRDLDRSGATE